MLYHTVGRLAEAGPDSLLLDVCCGTGTIGLTLAKQVRESGAHTCVTQTRHTGYVIGFSAAGI
jgi:ubiquinone/menaquinone biosynthesis C-methylase UbiE